MAVIWSIATVAALFGAIAGALFQNTPLLAVAFGLMAVAFAIAAYREISSNREISRR